MISCAVGCHLIALVSRPIVPPRSSRWAVSNREMLMAQNSSLEFKLHRLYFISLLMGGTANQREALQYAKNFQPFALNHQKGTYLSHYSIGI